MKIQTTKHKTIEKIIGNIKLPISASHKGQNGKILIVGGSTLFHSASLWAAEVASHFVDMVHYSSTEENEVIFSKLKQAFRNGMIVPQGQIDEYISQDDCILIGPGMMREGEEGERTRHLTQTLIEKYPEKKFVFDAGALQMMRKEWLMKLKTTPILTPHMKEFEGLFGISVINKSPQDIVKIIKETANKYKVVILLKAIVDYISDGKLAIEIKGGNAGLTKGGTGDVLAGLTGAFFTKNDPMTSSQVASILLKVTAEKLFDMSGYWYNVNDIIKTLPKVLAEYHPFLNKGGN